MLSGSVSSSKISASREIVAGAVAVVGVIFRLICGG